MALGTTSVPLMGADPARVWRQCKTAADAKQDLDSGGVVLGVGGLGARGSTRTSCDM